MAKKMLIDATQAEETRVAVLDHNGRLEDFDLEVTSKQQIKGNIYLAKVTRVEPSLQAAFVNFGGNRHGFLPFSEIHPDYYRIPVSDREALQAEIEAMLAKRGTHEEEDADIQADEEAVADVIAELESEGEVIPDLESDGDEAAASEEEASEEKPKRGRRKAAPAKAKTEKKVDDNPEPVLEEGEMSADEDGADEDLDDDASDEDGETEEAGTEEGGENAKDGERRRGRRGHRFRRSGGGGGRERGRGRGRGRGGDRGSSRRREEEDGEEDIQNYLFRRLHRSYKIQEVIKRGQIMLVQATKEERGNKGAAMTSYLSLPGRYCVLMPNSPRSGGVSRKVHDRGERDRLREVFGKLQIPDGMSTILRTAGVGQGAEEIERDYAYLQKTWGQIREKTLASTAPALIYQEGSVVKRAIRDIFREDVSDILISGKEAHAEAKEFMEMLVPTQVKKIKEHKGSDPLFVQYRAEEQIAAIDTHTITLKSGGYLVFSPTEALVAIDINSGRSTRERHIEETALNTNLEAAEEIARQLRLRDIGGLIVIDFIDMEDPRHNILVERKLESALSKDRARIQIGRISQFGLLELSRQRLRPSLTESHFMTCPTCQGQGMVRTTESMAVVILRAIAQEGAKAKSGVLQIAVPQDVCLYLLNQKRDNISALEKRYDLEIALSVDESLGAATFRIDRLKASAMSRRMVDMDDETAHDHDHDHEEENNDESDDDTGETASGDDNGSRNGRRRGRRGGRNRRGGRRENGGEDETESADASDRGSEVAGDPRKNRRGRAEAAPSEPTDTNAEEADQPKKPSRGRKQAAEAGDTEQAEPVKPAKAEKAEKVEKVEEAPKAPTPPPVRDYEVVNQAPETPKKGWWRKVVS